MILATPKDQGLPEDLCATAVVLCFYNTTAEGPAEEETRGTNYTPPTMCITHNMLQLIE